MQNAPANAVYLVDASVYIFRAYYSLPDSITGSDGEAVNAVYGFGMFLCDLLDQAQPGHIAVAFDESLTSSFRNEIYPDYKANRDPAPPGLKRQMERCQDLVRALGITALSSDTYEADDLIGALTARAHADDRPVVIVTRDKDLAQLLQANDALWDFAAGELLFAAEVKAKYGVRPDQMVDYLGLTGDSVDNIPGVPGIGPKTASALLTHFVDLDELFDGLEAVAELKLRGAKRLGAKLEQHREQALMSRRLCRIPTDIDLPAHAEQVDWAGAKAEAIEGWCTEIGLGQRLRARMMAQVRD